MHIRLSLVSAIFIECSCLSYVSRWHAAANKKNMTTSFCKLINSCQVQQITLWWRARLKNSFESLKFSHWFAWKNDAIFCLFAFVAIVKHTICAHYSSPRTNEESSRSRSWGFGCGGRTPWRTIIFYLLTLTFWIFFSNQIWILNMLAILEVNTGRRINQGEHCP